MSDRGLTGANTLAYRGVRPSTPPNLVMHPRRPTVNDYKEFCVGDIWIDSSGRLLTPPVFPGNGDVYMLTSVAGNVASWVPFIGGLMSLSGDVGAHVHGDVNQNIQLTSNIGNLTITGNPGANRLEFDSSGGGNFVEKLISDDFVDVLPAGAGQIYIHGINGITTTGFGSTVTIDGVGALGTFPTDNGIAVPVAGVLNINANNAALGCGSSVTFSAPGATNLIQLNVSDALTNTIIGNGAGRAGITGQHNTVLGVGAATGLTTSSNNTIIGYHAAQGLTTGTPNIVIGSTAGSAMTGAESYNLLIGHPGVAGHTRLVTIADGGGVVALHNYPGQDASTVNFSNIFAGNGAGNFTLTGLGGDAGNSGFGDNALHGLTTGSVNAAVGSGALAFLTTGYSNVAIGHSCGADPTAMPVPTGITTGNDNVLLGYETGIAYTGAESGNVLIGSAAIFGNVTSGVAGESNVTKIINIRGVTTNVADAVPVLIDSASQLGTVSSSIRYKDNVEDMGSDSDNVLNLRPVTFEYKKHPGIRQYGLIAEEVVEHMPRLVVFDSDGLPETVKYHELPAILLNEMQKLVKRIDQLEKNLQRYEEL